jgi:hypothetical protein
MTDSGHQTPRFDRSATRDVWACPNGHKDWNRRSTELVGRSIRFTCHLCQVTWTGTREQRDAVVRHWSTRQP